MNQSKRHTLACGAARRIGIAIAGAAAAVNGYHHGMRIRVLSDLHLEFCDWTPPAADADVIVLAGDIHVGVQGLEWARERFPATPVIYVAGNHEFYGGQMREVLAALRKAAARLGIYLLDGDQVVLGDTRFLGATLWTDFALYGTGPALLQAMNDAERGMNDFRLIRHSDVESFRPEHARQIHLAQVAWLAGKCNEAFDGPSSRRVVDRYRRRSWESHRF